MIELYRRMKQGGRAKLFKKVSIGAACFMVLAGSGIMLAYLTRDKSSTRAAETKSQADSSKQRTSDASALLAGRTTDNDEKDNDESQEVKGAETTQPANSSSANVVQRAEDVKLIAEHQELFEAAISLLGDYEQAIIGGIYTELPGLKSKADAAIAKTTPGSIGSDPRASYNSSIMISVQQVADLLAAASSAYSAGAADLQAGNENSGDAKFTDGQAKASKAEALYRTIK